MLFPAWAFAVTLRTWGHHAMPRALGAGAHYFTVAYGFIVSRTHLVQLYSSVDRRP